MNRLDDGYIGYAWEISGEVVSHDACLLLPDFRRRAGQYPGACQPTEHAQYRVGPYRYSSLEDALGWVAAAGGLAVIAHPARYPMTGSKLRRLVGEFRELGGAGMEVVSGCHSRNDINTMAGCARSMDLLASRGSDYHGPENPWVQLGQLAELPAGCRPVWESEGWPVN